MLKIVMRQKRLNFHQLAFNGYVEVVKSDDLAELLKAIDWGFSPHYPFFLGDYYGE